MKHLQRLHVVPLLALCLAGLGLSARAQMSTPSGSPGASTSAPSAWANRSDGYSLLPYTRRGYIGLNLGKPEFDVNCGVGGFACDDASVGGYLYTGGLINDWLGMELGYLHTDDADRGGGVTRARGVNLSLLVRAPLGPVNVFAKAGAMYGQTRVSADALSGIVSGSRRGWGGTYGAGLGFDFTPTSGVVLEWSRYEMRFPSVNDRQDLDMISLGYVHRF